MTFSVSSSQGRKANIERRISAVIAKFGYYLVTYDRRTPFAKLDQLKFHQLTINRRREVGSAAGAANDLEFCKRLHRTLHAWGRNGRFPGLKPFESFHAAIRASAPTLAEFESSRIDDPDQDLRQVAHQLWSLIDNLSIVESGSRIVSGTKALHHLLPDLVVPMDRRYTQTFFGLHNPEFQYGAASVFPMILHECARIARSVPLDSYVDDSRSTPWRTSRTKLIDNALVGFCVAEHLPAST